ncbi:MAG: hypothetical protein GF368_05570 [Candidatus Aenigmarchaeota archaeon]|nr:hypothetical protein [Candidatus Aenigmarchaeota archaeon]
MSKVGTVTAIGYGSTYEAAYRNAANNNINDSARRKFGSRATVGDVREVDHTVMSSRDHLRAGWGNGPDRHEVTVKGTVYLPKGSCAPSGPSMVRYRGRVPRVRVRRG